MKRGATVASISVLGIILATVSYGDLASDILESSGVKGGLVVHLGCGDGRLTAALHATDSYLVHGLDGDAEKVEEARDHIRSLGIYGKVSADRLQGRRLPYVDNLANLVVVSTAERPVSGKEIVRVLAPNGVAMVKGKWDAGDALEPRSPAGLAGWTKFVKPWPAEIDEWTHYLHGPDGNQVAADTVVGPPQHVKWLAKPYWGRDHRYGNQTAMVSAEGRLFYVGNDVQPSVDLLPDRPFLIARDAFNGVPLWNHPIYPNSYTDILTVVDDPEKYLLYEPLFPMELKVVAVEDKLYVAFGRHGEIQVLDAASGKLLKVYEETAHTEEIVYSGGTLLTVAAAPGHTLSDRPRNMAELNAAIFTRRRATVMRAIDARSGKKLWEYDSGRDGGFKVSPVVTGDRVYVIVGDDLVRMDISTGRRVWRRRLPIDDAVKERQLRSVIYIKGPSVYDHLIASDDVVVFAYMPDANPTSRDTTLHAFSSDTGEHLWSYVCTSPERAGASAFVVGNHVWVHTSDDGNGFPLIALDIRTGKEQKRIDTTKIFDIGHHHRCYGNRATERFVLTGRRGVEFIDLDSGKNWLHHWVRGKCRFGVLPCNGLLYTPPHNCSCYPFSTFKGFTALAAAESSTAADLPLQGNGEGRLEKGPAYGNAASAGRGGSRASNSADWPTHRHDGGRSGTTPDYVEPNNLQQVWHTSLGARPSGLTAGGGGLFVCTPDTHQVHALDIESGKTLWNFTAGGRVDSPPTMYKGLVLFGSADGYVYCLRAADGRLVWRFLAAPADRRMFAYGQLESVWPVHGAVLVKNGRVYFTAGRSSLLDGGIAVYGLEPETGRIMSRNGLYKSYADAESVMLGNTGHDYSDDLGVLQDILVSGDTHLYLKQLKLDENGVVQGKSDKLISGNGLLNPAWFSRIGWYFGTPVESRKTQADITKYNIMESPRQGQYLVFDDAATYSVRLYPNVGKFSQSFVPGGKGYRVFADDNASLKNKWNIFVPIRVEAMVATGGTTLYMAGSPDVADQADPWGAIEGRKGGLLWAVSAENGEKLAEYELDAPPVFDGLIAANDKLFMSLMDESVVCLEGE